MPPRQNSKALTTPVKIGVYHLLLKPSRNLDQQGDWQTFVAYVTRGPSAPGRLVAGSCFRGSCDEPSDIHISSDVAGEEATPCATGPRGPQEATAVQKSATTRRCTHRPTWFLLDGDYNKGTHRTEELCWI